MRITKKDGRWRVTALDPASRRPIAMTFASRAEARAYVADLEGDFHAQLRERREFRGPWCNAELDKDRRSGGEASGFTVVLSRRDS